MSEFRDVPQDTITSMSANGDILCASWDRHITLFSSTTLGIRTQVRTHEPVLRTAFGERIATGDISGTVDIYSNALDPVQQIRTDVGGVQLLHEHRGRILAGGWNRRVCFIGENVEDLLEVEKKIYCSDLAGDVLLVGQQDCVVAYDLRTNASFFRRRFSMPLRSVALTAGGFFAGTTAGRIYYEDFEDESRSYVFNAHYSVSAGVKTFYPVNSLKMSGSLFSGGSDGRVLRWRLSSKKTCKEVAMDGVGVSSLCTADGQLVVGFSYSHDLGECSAGTSRVAMFSM